MKFSYASLHCCCNLGNYQYVQYAPKIEITQFRVCTSERTRRKSCLITCLLGFVLNLTFMSKYVLSNEWSKPV